MDEMHRVRYVRTWEAAWSLHALSGRQTPAPPVPTNPKALRALCFGDFMEPSSRRHD